SRPEAMKAVMLACAADFRPMPVLGFVACDGVVERRDHERARCALSPGYAAGSPRSARRAGGAERTPCRPAPGTGSDLRFQRNTKTRLTHHVAGVPRMGVELAGRRGARAPLAADRSDNGGIWPPPPPPSARRVYPPAALPSQRRRLTTGHSPEHGARGSCS